MKTETKTSRLDSLTEGLAQRIVDGDYPPGTRMPTESALQTQWSVSRSVVREAMKVLESQGLVRIEQGRGTFVNDASHVPLKDQISMALRRAEKSRPPARGNGTDQWSELLDVRRVLEVEVAARAAKHATTANLDAMQASIDVLRSQPNEQAGYVDADLAFHRALAEATQNPLWVVLLNSMNDLLRRYREVGFTGKEGVLAAARQHQKILDAVRTRDPEKAREAMQSHLKKSEQDLRKLSMGNNHKEKTGPLK